MRVSNWVHTCHNMNKITGFILDCNDQDAIVFVTKPKDYGTIKMSLNNLILGEIIISPDDIPMLIDMSLAVRDEEWFMKWTNELKLWKRVDEISWK